MKVQSLAVIFAIIILPVIIILSYYIHKEVDTIALQTAYDTKLIDATHDAMASFELNTANEDLSSVADALRSIIEASNNTFFNTLATNLGMSNANKSYIQSYIPSILYTLYDGYYIYSPTRVPEVLVGEKTAEAPTLTPTAESTEDLRNNELLTIGDPGIRISGSTAEGIGTYEYTGNSSDRVNYDSITNKYEYGQILYRNTDGTYSPTLNSETYYKQDYILKSYMPYSARYKGTKDSINYDLTINYTLDNYMSVMGYIGDIYYSKTGYLIGKNVVNYATKNGEDLLSYNENDAEAMCLEGNSSIVLSINPYLEDGKTRTEELTYVYMPYKDVETDNFLSYSEQKERLIKLYENSENYYNEYRNTGNDELLGLIRVTNEEIQGLEASLENLTAITYYVKAQVFSNWVYNNLGNDGLSIREKDISEDTEYVNNANEINKKAYGSNLFGNGSGDVPAFHHDFSKSEKIIFDEEEYDPEFKESTFSQHKFDVIKNSIQYNLNLALSSYDEMAKGMDIKMPILSDAEWEKVLSKVSIVSFMQGFNCGLKYYNNYAVVSSTNNELTVIPNEIYYTKKEEYNAGDLASTECLYHRIDCEELGDTDSVISFRSKEVKYDKIYDKNSGRYKYDHKNFACYNCIVNSNFEKDIKDKEGNTVKGYSDDIIISTLSTQKKKNYFRALGKAKQNIYKTNALTDSNGYEKLSNNEFGIGTYQDEDGIYHLGLYITARRETKPLKDIKAIEFTISNVEAEDPNLDKIPFQIRINPPIGGSNYGDVINVGVIELNVQELPQTVTIPIHIEDISESYINTTIKSFGFHAADEIHKMPTSSIRLKDAKIIYE